MLLAYCYLKDNLESNIPELLKIVMLLFVYINSVSEEFVMTLRPVCIWNYMVYKNFFVIPCLPRFFCAVHLWSLVPYLYSRI